MDDLVSGCLGCAGLPDASGQINQLMFIAMLVIGVMSAVYLGCRKFRSLSRDVSFIKRLLNSIACVAIPVFLVVALLGWILVYHVEFVF